MNSEHRTRLRLINRAHSAVREAIARGNLVALPCEVCGRLDTVAHHDDYTRPLDVRWMCEPCHMDHHAGAAPRDRVAIVTAALFLLDQGYSMTTISRLLDVNRSTLGGWVSGRSSL